MQYLYVRTRDSDLPLVAVEYRPAMKLYEYIKELARACGSRSIHDGCTIPERFIFQAPELGLAPSTQVIFNRENRSKLLGELIPPGSTLERKVNCDRMKTLHGNAVRGDLTDECVFCSGTADGMTNFELENCAHRFHAGCMACFVKATSNNTWACPVCRGGFSDQDRHTMFLMGKFFLACSLPHQANE
jgi:hypothetical protein